MFHRIVQLVVGHPAEDLADPEHTVRREWDRLRAEARTPQERQEIDAVFSRYAA